jgi:hypothetical protein
MMLLAEMPLLETYKTQRREKELGEGEIKRFFRPKRAQGKIVQDWDGAGAAGYGFLFSGRDRCLELTLPKFARGFTWPTCLSSRVSVWSAGWAIKFEARALCMVRALRGAARFPRI